ncbi:MAG: nicotinate phosphoribosyltransferase [Nanoarchaeota archaeon]|nr:nicotinate phosphoribosyltransferase [Nanoarchaeota archaeon]MBU1322225.1 nicotinate phosphoribosyltransferase [Nanoarchaeota archaeon]MBU1597766.1 nicotinate phosphoribosyltransferase [Nanoarchaeota archaeon]MBU2442030.1 nicotinate phosphoribosyltransferase [Nanoarchaeota archaeon]
MKEKTMLTDLYQLTMNAAYHDNGKADETATFDLFIRKLPQDWGYFIANGIEDAIDYITNIEFSNEDIKFLEQQEFFKPAFIDYQKTFKFEGDVYAVREGTAVFGNQPILRVTAKRNQAQFVETALLNMINYQTMIASKANRVVNAAKDAKVVDYGLRRAQEESAAMKGARAAYIGGAIGTSNVKAGKEYGIKILGTHAHSFVMSFENEIDAFRAYVKTFPNKATLLIDTYDTVEGAKNAAIVAKELEKQGDRLSAVRLDSGDLCDLSKKVRKILDERGLHYVNIVASNDLNEYKIDDMTKNGAKIDGYGVGTEMITAKPVAAIPGVYKLVEDNGGAKIKLSPDKKTYPGKKQVYRVTGADGKFSHDVLGLEYEGIAGTPLLEKVVSQGKRVTKRRTLEEIRQHALESVEKLPDHLKQVRVTEQYEMKISDGLNELIERLTQQYGNENNGGEQK